MSVEIQETNFNFTSALTDRSETNRIVIHHSASGPNTTAEEVHQWHLARGYSGIGYHYFIKRDGAIQRGRPANKIGAHAIGANYDGIGICLAGNFETEAPTDAQMESLAALITEIRVHQGDIPYMGHCNVDPEYHPTACPGTNFPWETLKKLMNTDGEQQIYSAKANIKGKVFEAYIKGGVMFFKDVPVMEVVDALNSKLETFDSTNRIAYIK